MYRKFFMIICVALMLIKFESASSQVSVITDLASFEKKFLSTTSDSVFLINFWATWCKPCVAELPYIVALDSIYKDKPYKTILMCLDFVKKLDTAVIPFLQKKHIQSQTYVLDLGDPNIWIDVVDPSWSGSIPATLIVTKSGKLFFEQEFHAQHELTDILTPLFNH